MNDEEAFLKRWNEHEEVRGHSLVSARKLPLCDDCPTWAPPERVNHFWSPDVCRKEHSGPCPRVIEYDHCMWGRV